MVFLSTTKEEVKELLILYCDILKRNKNIDIRVEDYILVLTNIASPWDKVNKVHTKYQYTIIYSDKNKKDHKYFYGFYDQDKHKQMSESAKIKLGKSIMSNLWAKIKPTL